MSSPPIAASSLDLKNHPISAIGYRPEIDGLRAIAVVPVILFHMGINEIKGGFVGVDVFFVISGYLITSILIREIESGQFSFRSFWARRIRRILPALITVTIVSLTVSHLFIFRGDLPGLGKQATAAMFSMANVYFWVANGNYWGKDAAESPFLHTWSLSLEEQFYLFFPLGIVLVLRGKPKWLPGLLVALIAASWGAFFYGSHHAPAATFYLLPFRAWELAIGCALATEKGNALGTWFGPKTRSMLTITGLFMLAYAYAFVKGVGGLLTVGVVAATLVIAYGQSRAGRLALGNPIAVHIGKISYSLYLWHWPVLVLANRLEYPWPTLTLCLPVYLLSLTTYYLVEKPTRRRRSITPIILSCYLLTITASIALVYSNPFYDDSAFEKAQIYDPYFDLGPRPVPPEYLQMQATMSVVPHEMPPDAYRYGGIITGNGTGPKVVVLGDSHGAMWSHVIHLVTKRYGCTTAFISMSGETPFVKLPLDLRAQGKQLNASERHEYDRSRLELIRSWRPDLVIVCCAWSGATEVEAHDLLDFLGEYAAQTLLMEQPPELAWVGKRNALQYAIYRGLKPEPGIKQYWPTGNTAKYEAGRESIRALAVKHKNCGYIPTADLFIRGSETLLLDGKNVLYTDLSHITVYGSMMCRDRIDQSIVGAIGRPLR